MASDMSTSSDDEKPKNTHDFAFILRPARVLIHAIAALSEPRFNPTQQAVIQVDKAGFELTVRVIDSMTEKEVFGFLCLKGSCLEDFECNKPMRKMVSFGSIYRVISDAAVDEFNDDSVVISVDNGSDKLSLQWGDKLLDLGLGLPVSIELQDLDYEYGKFPDVCYGLEAVIPSQMLTNMVAKLLNMAPSDRPTDAMLTLTAATLIMELEDDLVLSTEDNQEQHKVRMDWQYWESLEQASGMADKCSMYLVTDPSDHIMMRFNLGVHGDFVYLTQADFLAVGELPYLGDFQSVLKTRAYAQ